MPPRIGKMSFHERIEALIPIEDALSLMAESLLVSPEDWLASFDGLQEVVFEALRAGFSKDDIVSMGDPHGVDLSAHIRIASSRL